MMLEVEEAEDTYLRLLPPAFLSLYFSIIILRIAEKSPALKRYRYTPLATLSPALLRPSQYTAEARST
jgi:hypothetical protein